MGKNIAAGIAGVVIAVALVWLIEMVGHSVYPPPPNLNFADADAMRDYTSTLPIGALPVCWWCLVCRNIVRHVCRLQDRSLPSRSFLPVSLVGSC